MKMRCCRRRTDCSTWRQLIRPQSRVVIAPFASVSCPTVNTPFANRRCLWQLPSLLRHWWNSALSVDSREPPPYPGRYPGPWLGPRSFAATPRAGGPCLYGRAGRRLDPTGRAVGRMSQFRGDYKRKRRRPTRKTGGVVGPRGQPWRRAPPPAGRSLLRVNSAAEGTFDGPMSFAFADPLPLPTDLPWGRCCRRGDLSWAPDVAASHALDTPGTRGRTSGFWARAGVITSAS